MLLLETSIAITASLMKCVCFLLVDLENLQPSGLAIQPSSSDHSQDDRKSVPNSKVGVANKTGVVADEST